MAEKSKTLVMKFGGTSVANADAMSKAAQIVKDARADWMRVVVVTSAISGATNLLLDSASQAAKGNLQTLIEAEKSLLVNHEKIIDAQVTNTERRAELKGKINWLGRIPHSETRRYYQEADIFINLTPTGSFDKTTLEAMACGIPVLTSSAASLPEVVGDAARLFDPNKIEEISRKMKELLLDSVAKQDLSAKGLTRAKNFSLEKSAAGIIDSIESVLP